MTDDSDDEEATPFDRATTQAVETDYKILGENQADSGTPVGVEGRVPNADGYGLATPDDAKIDGDLFLSALVGDITGGERLTTLAGSGLTISGGGLSIENRTYEDGEITRDSLEYVFDGTIMPDVVAVALPSLEFQPSDSDHTGNSDSDGSLAFGDMIVHRQLSENFNTKFYDEFNKARVTADTSTIKKPVTVRVDERNGNSLLTVECQGTWIRGYDAPTLNAQNPTNTTEAYIFSIDYVSVTTHS